MTPGPVSARRVPPGLRPGDRVAVVAPSGPVDPARLARGLDRLRALGYDAVAAGHVLDRHPDLPYLAGADADRAGDLQRAWCDPRVRAVVAARGGYGAGRLAAHLDLAAMRAAGPRLLVGSSDATALHQLVGDALGLATLYGPMASAAVLTEPGPGGRAAAETGWGALAAALADPGAVPPLHGRTVVGGRAEGVLLGGTLALLAASVGGPFSPRYAGCVLLLEDVGEAPHRLDRMLAQLAAAGALDGVRGVALGPFVDGGPDADAVAEHLVAGLGVPVVAGLEVGHGPVQRTVPLGVRAVLDADAGQLRAAAPAA